MICHLNKKIKIKEEKINLKRIKRINDENIELFSSKLFNLITITHMFIRVNYKTMLRFINIKRMLNAICYYSKQDH